MAAPDASTLLLDYAQDKIAVLDEGGNYTYVNEAAGRILGYDVEELVGRNAFEDVHPEDRATVRATFEDVIHSEAAYTSESETYRYRTADGEWVWLESKLSNLTDPKLDGYVVSSRDVTDRERARVERWKTHTRLEELAEATDDVLWTFSGDWEELLFVNPAYESLYGGDVGRLRADPSTFLDHVHPEDRSCVEAAMERLSAGESVDVEYRVNADRNYDYSVWVQAEPIVEDGEVVRVVGFSRDVTDRRRRERQLAVMDNLLRHNVRNKASEILGSAELLAEGRGDPEERSAVIRRAAEQLVDSAEKQREIVELLTKPAKPRPMPLGTTVESAVDRATRRYPDSTVEVDVPPGVEVCALEELECAVAELVENAALHSGDAPANVRVAADPDDGVVHLTVRDDCPAMPAFDHRVLTGDHDTDAVYHSSGCGLWLVYWIVDLSDGTVDYETPEGGGNEVTITLARPTV